ncbi:MAG: ABC transporter permease [Candidatus Raymondbacteria bacterium RifOxyC12_full_50_8]|uniref:ABC transporter permease n=1 Tax=Candidatus Raymondbacteria bacterium RIFOXYD12_FULL_49_13 TaxID=1817890 RepID=A0A1F7FGT6_UNCRA|nr:MAG: ABC transporter permease [Candidatus Raymondbacteria bacterium RIFOXYA2_FULL_49_16]OGK00674.1 MAG: ABC transporter permease [Candidatus Raymondbacteria bacterium RifOxyB12_full_50_8]OGK03077.1 MAG: ABC transporter permease [Candidatus Raymondbacteria bacterium RifOxyC12_full_50_8]OGK05833.1 MAG: ABC transporter permease [Candidatus Raymondbacteria bacterium RIFOXYD12_FULL_49_13]OGP43326.1 MAG: ABC transporter permease [Candidatus Raymondbacteria bacterium RIFOXYB2_FULL_49_35]
MVKRILTFNVIVLSLVSMFTDIASEMLYPIMPIFLKSIGFSVVLIGVLEGFAEAVAGLSKGYFGRLSDLSGKRVRFVRMGYLLSALSKPLLAAFTWPLWIFGARTLDRLGKGVRTASRDALLSDEATPETKGRVFGFHRSLDTLGAAIGPFLALGFLFYYPGQYSKLFLLAFVPGCLAVALTLLLREKPHEAAESSSRPKIGDFITFWVKSSPTYKRLVSGLLFFALFNSSDAFLLLRMKQAGLNDTSVIGIYIFYNLIFALGAYPLGSLADKIGLKKVLVGGMGVFAVVYAGMAVNTTVFGFIGLLLFYGIYAAATEGVSKAWISNITDKKETATAIGTYTAFQSVCTLIASSLAGAIWYFFGPAATFMVSAIAAALAMAYISRAQV